MTRPDPWPTQNRRDERWASHKLTLQNIRLNDTQSGGIQRQPGRRMVKSCPKHHDLTYITFK
jgi:hypothetical protein